MHPETSRQLAAERLADFHRQAEADALAAQSSPRRRLRARLWWNAAPGYARRAAAGASAPTGPRSGT
jgi:hypothetical protein